MTSNPFLTVWTKPKETAYNMKKSQNWLYFFLILIITGISSSLVYLQGGGEGSTLFLILLGVLILGPIISVGGAFIVTLFYWLLGKLFGGTGSYKDVLFAQSVSYIPAVIFGVFSILGMLFFLGDYFAAPSDALYMMYETNPFVALVGLPVWYSVIYFFLQWIVGIWSLIIAGKAIGVGHNISTGKAWGVLGIMIGLGIILAIVFIFFLVIIFSI